MHYTCYLICKAFTKAAAHFALILKNSVNRLFYTIVCITKSVKIHGKMRYFHHPFINFFLSLKMKCAAL